MTRPRAEWSETQGRAIVTARAAGTCEGCRQERASEWAHRVARSQGGTWRPSNGLHLCHSCHAWQHANPTAAAKRLGWTIRTYSPPLDPALVPVGLAWPWLGWFQLTDDGVYNAVSPYPFGLPEVPDLTPLQRRAA